MIRDTSDTIDLNKLTEYEELDKNIQKLKTMGSVHILKKSQFYMNGDKLREHIGNHKNYAILLKQEELKEDIPELRDDRKQVKLFASIVKLSELKLMKKVNGNIIRKMQPKTLHDVEKMPLVMESIKLIDNM